MQGNKKSKAGIRRELQILIDQKLPIQQILCVRKGT